LRIQCISRDRHPMRLAGACHSRGASPPQRIA
jgi:hypothetical protein